MLPEMLAQTWGGGVGVDTKVGDKNGGDLNI